MIQFLGGLFIGVMAGICIMGLLEINRPSGKPPSREVP